MLQWLNCLEGRLARLEMLQKTKGDEHTTDANPQSFLNTRAQDAALLRRVEVIYKLYEFSRGPNILYIQDDTEIQRIIPFTNFRRWTRDVEDCSEPLQWAVAGFLNFAKAYQNRINKESTSRPETWNTFTHPIRLFVIPFAQKFPSTLWVHIPSDDELTIGEEQSGNGIAELSMNSLFVVTKGQRQIICVVNILANGRAVYLDEKWRVQLTIKQRDRAHPLATKTFKGIIIEQKVR